MKRKLLVKYLRTGTNSGRLQIVFQSHRCAAFCVSATKTEQDFFVFNTADHSIRISSCDSMQWSGGSIRKLFVRGSNTDRDFHIVVLDNCIDDILEGILAYNNKFSNNKLVLEDVAEEIYSASSFDRKPADYTPFNFAPLEVEDEDEDEDDYDADDYDDAYDDAYDDDDDDED